MSFTGDLEHLSIVDVVQLLHATRKSGTLTVTGKKGAVQLVFSDGYIVSANHFDDRIRIGAILVEAGVLARGELERALAEQQAAGDRRRPLIAALVEGGSVTREDAFRALESLIELTIVDILTWKTGSFTLEVGAVAVADEYRYFPEKLHEEVQFHTENVLMEALRIFDEKKRDGRLQEREQAAEAAAETLALTGGAAALAGASPGEGAGPLSDGVVPLPEGVVPLTEEAALALSPDDLGLEDVEGMERRIPGVFAPLKDRPAGSPHPAAIRELAPELPEEAQRSLSAFLDALPSRPAAEPGLAPAVILLAADALLTYCLAEVCRHAGMGLFATTDPEDVPAYAEHQRGKGRVPILVQDLEGLERAGLAALQLPHLGAVALAAAPPPESAGIAAFLRRPPRGDRTDPGDAAALQRFLASFPALLRGHAREQGAWVAAATRRCAARLLAARDAPAVAQAVLAAVADLGARALVLIVHGEELVTGGGPALHAPGAAPAPAPGIRIPLAQSPLLREAVGSARCAILPAADVAATRAIHAVIGAPADPATLLLPLAAAGRTASLVYGDFGTGPAAPPPLDLLETFAAQAGAALELFLARRKLEKPAR